LPDASPRLVLASASPRRLDLLRQAGIEPDLVAPSDIDETARPNELPRQLAARLALAKVRAAAACHGDAYILAADTVVACGRRLLQKPKDRAAARDCLSILSGRRHRVHTGLAVVAPDGRLAERVVTTIVTFKRLDRQEIQGYLASGQWQGKAGGYAVQGLAEQFVARLNGSYSNVVGLPLHETVGLLVGLGFPVWRPPEI
jgi:septum formation protein